MEKNGISIKIRILDNMIKRSIDRRMKEHGLEFLTSGNGRIIGYLFTRQGEDVFQRDFERCFGITRSTASKVVNLMEEKGFIKRERVPSDARLRRLVLTKRAEDMAEWLHHDHQQMEDILTDGFSSEELRQLEQYLNRIQENLEKFG